MAWSASIVATTKDDVTGRLRADVQYTDGRRTVSDTLWTSAPDADWPRPLIARRLAELAAVDSVSVTTGPVTPPPPVTEDPARAAYRADLALVRRYRSASDELGQVDPTRIQEYVDALARVRAGFGPTTLDLFG